MSYSGLHNFFCLTPTCYLLIPSLIEGEVSEQEITPFSLPTCYGGLGINNCVKSASSAFQSSQEGSVLFIDAIVNHGRVCLADYLAHLNAVHIRVTRDCGDQSCLLLSSLSSGFPFLTTLLMLFSRLLIFVLLAG